MVSSFNVISNICRIQYRKKCICLPHEFVISHTWDGMQAGGVGLYNDSLAMCFIYLLRLD